MILIQTNVNQTIIFCSLAHNIGWTIKCVSYTINHNMFMSYIINYAMFKTRDGAKISILILLYCIIWQLQNVVIFNNLLWYGCIIFATKKSIQFNDWRDVCCITVPFKYCHSRFSLLSLYIFLQIILNQFFNDHKLLLASWSHCYWERLS